MPITEFLERNAREFPNDVCLVEINPEIKEDRRVTWKEYELIEPSPKTSYRREITWSVFNEKANRFANLLLHRGIEGNTCRLPVLADVSLKQGIHVVTHHLVGHLEVGRFHGDAATTEKSVTGHHPQHSARDDQERQSARNQTDNQFAPAAQNGRLFRLLLLF